MEWHGILQMLSYLLQMPKLFFKHEAKCTYCHAVLFVLMTAASFAGKPMVWFGRYALAHTVYGPAALAGLLVPFALLPRAASQVDAAVLGASLVHAALAAALTRCGMRSGFAFALWAFAGLASLLVPRKVSSCLPCALWNSLCQKLSRICFCNAKSGFSR